MLNRYQPNNRIWHASTQAVGIAAIKLRLMNPCTSLVSDSQRKGSYITVFGSLLVDGWQEGQTGGRMSVPIMTRGALPQWGVRKLRRELADQGVSGKRPWKPQQSFYGHLSVTTWVSRYQKKHSPTYHPDHPILISFFHLLRSIASSLFKLRAWQSFCTTSLHVLFGLPLGLEPSTSYSIHVLITQSVSSFCNTCPYHRNLFCWSIKSMLGHENRSGDISLWPLKL